MTANLEKFVWTGIAAGVALCIGTAPIAAGSNGPKPTIAKPQTHATGSMTHGQSGAVTHGQSGATTHGKPATTTHGQSGATTHGKPATTTATAKGNSKKTPTTTAGSSTTTSSGTAGGTAGTASGTVTPTSDTTTLSKAQHLLAKNTSLATKLSTRLGGLTSTQLSAYAAGFKNLGQFVAATNVSTNLNIPFADLKAAMTGYGIDGKPIAATPGTTTTTTLSLGQAIQKLGGTDSATATQAATTATTQANATIASSTSTTTTTTTTTGKTKKH